MSGEVTWVAAAGFGLSIVSLGWQAFTTWVRLPRLEVGLESRLMTRDDAGVSVVATNFVLTVHNRGAEPVEIYDLGLESETGLRFSHRTGPKGLATTPGEQGKLRTVSRLAKRAEMPVTIPARSTLSWTILDGATKDHGPSVPWRGWIERYRASGKPRHTASKTVLFRVRS